MSAPTVAHQLAMAAHLDVTARELARAGEPVAIFDALRQRAAAIRHEAETGARCAVTRIA